MKTKLPEEKRFFYQEHGTTGCDARVIAEKLVRENDCCRRSYRHCVERWSKTSACRELACY